MHLPRKRTRGQEVEQIIETGLQVSPAGILCTISFACYDLQAVECPNRGMLKYRKKSGFGAGDDETSKIQTPRFKFLNPRELEFVCTLITIDVVHQKLI
jgi:hypothetical protein